MEKRINEFISNQTVATICCTNEAKNPYCFTCFYAFNPDTGLLYFKSSLNTAHGPLLKQLPMVAGTILPAKLNPLAIQGIQFTGRILDFENQLSTNASSSYHKKYPFALAMHGEVWTIELDYIKMTDNTLSFGKKLTWNREELPVLI